MPKQVTLTESEKDKLARCEFDHQRWQARLESLQAQAVFVQGQEAEAKARKEGCLATLSAKYGRLVNADLETGVVEVAEDPVVPPLPGKSKKHGSK